MTSSLQSEANWKSGESLLGLWDTIKTTSICSTKFQGCSMGFQGENRGRGQGGVKVKEREKMRICYFKSYLKSPARIITRELYTKHIVPSHQKVKIILKATREKLLMTYKVDLSSGTLITRSIQPAERKHGWLTKKSHVKPSSSAWKNNKHPKNYFPRCWRNSLS